MVPPIRWNSAVMFLAASDIQLGRGEPITARCITCGVMLQAVEVAEVGALVISCPDGHTTFRVKRDRKVNRPPDNG
jgi:hypothetical protein